MTAEGTRAKQTSDQNDGLERFALEMSIPSEPGAVTGVRRETARLCAQAGFSPDDCADLDLALGEALANAVVHARKRPAVHEETGTVRVSVWDYRSHLIVQVQDNGKGFDPPAPPYEMPSVEMNVTHGRGLPLMQHLTDALVVARGDAREGGSSIFLVKGRASN